MTTPYGGLDPLDLAIIWAERGIPVFPGAVSQDATTGRIIKRPLTKHGFYNAELEDFKIAPMFERPPISLRSDEDLVACGIFGPAGDILIDLDQKPGKPDGVKFGTETLGLPLNTYNVTTISGAKHYVYAKPDPYQKIGNGSPWEKNGIDVRADAGYVVLAGSTTRHGNWAADPAYPWPSDGVLMELPMELWEPIVARGFSGRRSGTGPIGDVRASNFDPAVHLPLLDSEIPALLEHLMHEGSGARVLAFKQDEIGCWLELTCDGRTPSASLGYVWPTGLNVYSAGWPGRPSGKQEVLPPPPWQSEIVSGWLAALHAEEAAAEPEPEIDTEADEDAEDPVDPAKGERPGEFSRDVPIARKMCQKILLNRFLFGTGLGWMMWDGMRWKKLPSDSMLQQAVSAYIEYELDKLKPIRDADGNVELDAHGKPKMPRSPLEKYRDIHAVNRLILACRLVDGMEVEGSKMDAQENLLTTPNCTLNLLTGAEQPHNPADLITKITRVPYVKGATDPDWDKALDAFSDDETMRWVQRAFGACLTGVVGRDDPVVFHQGEGENGKSTFLAAITKAAGDHATLVSDAVLASGSVDQHAGMELLGARIAMTEELTDDHNAPMAKIKKFVATPRITSRLLYKDPVTFEARHGLHVSTNYLPFVKETDRGTWRRLVLVRYMKTFVGAAKDPALLGRLTRDEGPQIAALAWMVEGARMWREGGQTLDETTWSEAMVEWRDEWRKETDLVARFLDEMVEATREPSDRISVKDLWSYFEFWMLDLDTAWSERTFQKRLNHHDWVTTKFLGIRRDSGREPMSLRGARILPGATTRASFLRADGTRF